MTFLSSSYSRCNRASLVHTLCRLAASTVSHPTASYAYCTYPRSSHSIWWGCRVAQEGCAAGQRLRQELRRHWEIFSDTLVVNRFVTIDITTYIANRHTIKLMLLHCIRSRALKLWFAVTWVSVMSLCYISGNRPGQFGESVCDVGAKLNEPDCMTQRVVPLLAGAAQEVCYSLCWVLFAACLRPDLVSAFCNGCAITLLWSTVRAFRDQVFACEEIVPH